MYSKKSLLKSLTQYFDNVYTTIVIINMIHDLIIYLIHAFLFIVTNTLLRIYVSYDFSDTIAYLI